MNASLRSLNLSTIEEIISYFLPTFNQLFSESRTMNEDVVKPSGREGFVEKEEVVINVDSLINEDDYNLSEKSALDSFKNKEDNAAIPKISVCQNAIEPNNRQKRNSSKMCSESFSHSQAWSTSANFSDIVCLGATVLIVTLLISVLIFYVFKDNEEEQ